MFCSDVSVEIKLGGISAIEFTVEPFVHVKSPVGEVLHCVRQHHYRDILEQWHQNPVEALRGDQFPC